MIDDSWRGHNALPRRGRLSIGQECSYTDLCLQRCNYDALGAPLYGSMMRRVHFDEVFDVTMLLR